MSGVRRCCGTLDEQITQLPLPIGQRLLQLVDLGGEPAQVSGHGRREKPARRISLRRREGVGRNLARCDLEYQETRPQALAARDVLPGRDDQSTRVVGGPAATVCAHPRAAGAVACGTE